MSPPSSHAPSSSPPPADLGKMTGTGVHQVALPTVLHGEGQRPPEADTSLSMAGVDAAEHNSVHDSSNMPLPQVRTFDKHLSRILVLQMRTVLCSIMQCYHITKACKICCTPVCYAHRNNRYFPQPKCDSIAHPNPLLFISITRFHSLKCTSNNSMFLIISNNTLQLDPYHFGYARHASSQTNTSVWVKCFSWAWNNGWWVSQSQMFLNDTQAPTILSGQVSHS